MFKLRFKVLWQYLVPQHGISCLAGAIANCRWQWLKNLLITKFVRRYGVDMSTAEIAEPTAYPTFNQFFTRALKPGIRIIAEGEKVIACPVDGFISQFGAIADGKLLQAKGANFDLATLLGGQAQYAQSFRNGQFMTLYLAPKNYHRIHMPMTGVLQEMIYVPGRLFSVNPISVQKVPNLFARNERVIAIFKTAVGIMAVILVGAMIVGSIETVWAGQVMRTTHKKIQRWSYTEQTIQINKGEELGRFQLGSTVILLFPQQTAAWLETLAEEKAVVMGEAIGNLH